MLANWIDPAPTFLYKDIYKSYNIEPYFESNSLTDNDLTSKIAIIGTRESSAMIRKAFYNLDLSSSIQNIADLGDIRNNDVGLMTSAYKELLSQGIFLIILDSNINTSLALGNAFKQLDKYADYGFICPSTSKASDCYNIYTKLIDEDKVNRLSFLAYQKHYSNPLNQVNPKLDLSGLLSLGKIRDDIKEAEPILRNQNVLAFDTRSIKASDSVGLKNQNNIGLTAEESCRLLQYATTSEKISALHLHGFEFENKKETRAGAELVACLIWYSIQGRLKAQHNKQSKDEMTNFIVDIDSFDQQLHFWKNEKSQHWWIEMPALGNKKENLIPCSEKEYLLAKENKMSDRLFNILAHY